MNDLAITLGYVVLVILGIGGLLLVAGLGLTVGSRAIATLWRVLKWTWREHKFLVTCGVCIYIWHGAEYLTSGFFQTYDDGAFILIDLKNNVQSDEEILDMVKHHLERRAN